MLVSPGVILNKKPYVPDFYSDHIDFIGHDNRAYRAYIEPVHVQFHINGALAGVSDPDWFVEDLQTHVIYKGETLGFAGAAGLPERWNSKVLSHSAPWFGRSVSFSFKNVNGWKTSGEKDGDHESNKINVLGTDRLKWTVTIDPISIPQNESSVSLRLHIRQLLP